MVDNRDDGKGSQKANLDSPKVDHFSSIIVYWDCWHGSMSWLCFVVDLIFLCSNDADGLMDDEISFGDEFLVFVHVWASVFVRLKNGVASSIPRSNFHR